MNEYARASISKVYKNIEGIQSLISDAQKELNVLAVENKYGLASESLIEGLKEIISLLDRFENGFGDTPVSLSEIKGEIKEIIKNQIQ